MPLINCEVNIILTWFEKCVISANTPATKGTRFAISDVSVVSYYLFKMQNYYNNSNRVLKECYDQWTKPL